MDDPVTRGLHEARDFVRRRVQLARLRLAGMRALERITGHRDERLRLAFRGDDVPSLDDEEHAVPERGPAPPIETVPALDVVMLVVGSRGDVQPFIPIGLGLAQRHRVRLATHAEFRELVEGTGLEFFPLAGDPRELMDYMVRTGGRVVPTRIDQLVEDVPRKRQIVGEIVASTWRACTEPDPDRADAPPFTADLVIANPPSYGHIHCAEALHVPLHMVFTMPWTPTRRFPHPMTHLDPGGDHPIMNYLSYAVVNTLMWAGVADIVNDFRERTLGLEPVSITHGPALLDDADVPMTYLFPERLVPRPPDWGANVDLTNFVFWNRADGYTPPDDVRRFLDAGEPPIYVGFGSCVVEDAAALTKTVADAVERAGVRAILSRGWAKLGDGVSSPNVLVVDDVPHDWLFPTCRAVCHHGGAGTTAAGLRAGLPTVVVPFFGDQFFWGQVVADAGAGRTLPADDLTADDLAEAFAFCLGAEAKQRAETLAETVRADDAVAMVIESVHARLPLDAMRCATGVTHLATVWCETCDEAVCDACRARDHAGHPTKPYRWVDWAGEPEPGLLDKLRDLVADASEALSLRDRPHRDGVVLGDGDRRRITRS